MVGPNNDNRTDKEIIIYLKNLFGNGWFSCRESKICKGRLNDLVEKEMLDKNKQPYTHTIYYKVL